MTLERFLRALFAHLPPGFLEVRLIEDRKGGKLVKRDFFASVEDLLASLDALLHIAQQRNAAVFYGVLPRREKGKGKSEDTIDGLVAWADLDFKDFADGEADARERLAQFPIPPSIVVRSGHGLHAYWLMREPTDPQELSRLSKGIARAIGGDHTFDAARLLRLPGTFNLKDPDLPLPVEIEVFEEDRRYNPSEIQEATEMMTPPDEEDPPKRRASRHREVRDDADVDSDGVPDIEIGDELSESVQLLIETHPRTRNLFFGTGKPPVGRDGRSLDQSSSGYDYSLVLELLKKGITDPSELATTLYHRPDEAAKAKGPDYIAATVAAASKRHKERVEAAGGNGIVDPASEIDFTVEKVRIFSSDPARYELTIEGKRILFTSAQLADAGRFSLRFMDALKRIPTMPTAGWAILINDWLAGAEVVEAPPEASRDPALFEAVQDAIEEMRLKDDAKDLHRGGACLIDEHTAFFRLSPLLKLLKEDHTELTRPHLCFILRELAWIPTKHTVEGRTVRGWAGPASTLRCARESQEESE